MSNSLVDLLHTAVRLSKSKHGSMYMTVMTPSCTEHSLYSPAESVTAYLPAGKAKELGEALLALEAEVPQK